MKLRRSAQTVRRSIMADAGDVVKGFYAAVVKRDLAAARRFLSDELLFVGLFQTYRGPEEYLAALTGLLGITIRLQVRAVIAQGDDAAVFFELETRAPAEATTLVAEWHRVKDGRIVHVESAFDGRPFAAMFAGTPGH
jgi:limonene-1,2-epoxide hydrolase